MSRFLTVLDNIHVAAPCKAAWSEMVGDDRSRFCKQCEKNVYDLSALTRPEAEALLIAKEGKLCVRYYQRADGTILTADCPDGVVRRNRKRRIVAATFGAMSAIAAAASAFVRAPMAVQGAVAPVAQAVEPEVMGKVALPAPDPEPHLVVGEIAPPLEPVMGRMAVTKPGKPKKR